MPSKKEYITDIELLKWATKRYHREITKELPFKFPSGYDKKEVFFIRDGFYQIGPIPYEDVVKAFPKLKEQTDRYSAAKLRVKEDKKKRQKESIQEGGQFFAEYLANLLLLKWHAYNIPESELAIIEHYNKATSTLQKRERKILEYKYGLNKSGKRKTWKETGKHFGISGGRTIQIVQKILRKLRHPKRAKIFKDGKEQS